MNTEEIANSTVNSWLGPMSVQLAIAIDALSWPLRLHISLIFVSAWLFVRYKQFKPKENGEQRTKRYAIPQPSTLPMVGNAHHFVKPGTDQLTQMLKFFNELGSIFKLKLFAHEFIVLSCPVKIQKILSSSNPSHLNKHRLLYDVIFAGIINGGLTAIEYEKWNPHRKILNRSFTYKSLQNQMVIVNLHAKQLLESIPGEVDRCGKDGHYPEINEMIHKTLLNSILHIMMGQEICTDEEREGFHYVFQNGKKIVTQRIVQPWLMFKPLWRLLPLKKKMDSIENMGESLTEKIVKRYKAKQDLATENKGKEGNLEKEDDIGARPYKSMMEDMLESGMSTKEILDETLTVMLAGHETTSWSITFLFIRLALNPDIQRQCRQEVDTLFDSKFNGIDSKLPPADLPDLNMEDLTSLKYLERCVHENLRIQPIVPIFVRRIDAPLKLDDEIELDVGTYVGICPYTLHRDPNIYPEPEKFDPDRFSPEKILERHQYSYLPFSAGIRNCIGWKQSILTIKLVTAWILRNYEIHTTDKWEDIGVEFQILLAAKNKVNLILKKRNNEHKD